MYHAPSAGEAALDWLSPPLLRQRGLMVHVCALNKPILSRVPTEFTFSTHRMQSSHGNYFACYQEDPTFVDSDLWLVHTKCLDLGMYSDPQVSRAVADKDHSSGLTGNVSGVAQYHAWRCGSIDAWIRKPCLLGPKGSRDSPNTSRLCRGGTGLNESRWGFWENFRRRVQRVPEWLRDKI